MNSISSNRLEIWLKVVSHFLAIAAFFGDSCTCRDTGHQQLERISIEAERIAETRAY